VTGRFLPWHDPLVTHLKYPTPPWAIAKDDIPLVESIIPSLKTPSTWPPVKKFFTEVGFMKTSEVLLLAGDAGAYFLRHIDIDDDVRARFVRLVRATQRSSHTPALTTTHLHVRHS
jgi:hypothetical protein